MVKPSLDFWSIGSACPLVLADLLLVLLRDVLPSSSFICIPRGVNNILLTKAGLARRAKC